MRLKYALIILIPVLFVTLHSIAQNSTMNDDLIQLSERFNREFAKNKNDAIHLADSFGLALRYEFDDGRVIELMRYKNGFPMYYTTHNAQGAGLINSDKVYPGGVAGLNVTGIGQTLGIWDAGRVRLEHVEFGGRVTQVDGNPSNNFHATHVAGTMVAAGIDAAAKGMSYASNLDAYDWNNDNSEMAAAAANGLKVSQHSYGYITGWHFNSSNQAWYWYGDASISTTEDYNFGFYSFASQEWDLIAYNAPNYLIVKSAGNDRGYGPPPGTQHYVLVNGAWTLSNTVRDLNGGADGYDCISHRGVSKNVLSVGAVFSDGNMSSFSSWGPTDDGRIKPDIVAKGVNVYSTMHESNHQYGSLSGTSMSGPMVSGSVGLLLQHQQDLHPGENLLASTVKALIIHSAKDGISGAPGPDYRYGWGLMDTQRAIEIMTDDALSGGIHIKEFSMSNNEEINVAVIASGVEPLRATIVWNDVPGVPAPPTLNPPDLMLVNDLDMRLTDLSKNQYFPYVLDPNNPSTAASTGDNFRDNVEMIHIDEPGIQETYNINVSHKSNLTGGSQDFSLIITGISEAIGVPVVTTAVITDITGTTATGGGTVTSDGGADVISRGLVWSTFQTPTIENNEGMSVDGYGTGDFTTYLTQLFPSKKYHVRAFATNSQGITYGDEQVFTTLTDDVCFPDWTPVPNLENNMQIVAQLIIDDEVSLNPNDVLGAFVGDECRGVASPMPQHGGLVFLTVSSNETSDEMVELRIWNSDLCESCDAGPGFEFVSQGELGTFFDPYSVTCDLDVDLDLNFGQGFTWFSVNVYPGSMLLNPLFADIDPCTDDRVIGQTQFALWTGAEWVGGLTEIDHPSMYRMRLCSNQSITITGSTAPLDPISLSPGFTWWATCHSNACL